MDGASRATSVSPLTVPFVVFPARLNHLYAATGGVLVQRWGHLFNNMLLLRERHSRGKEQKQAQRKMQLLNDSFFLEFFHFLANGGLKVIQGNDLET